MTNFLDLAQARFSVRNFTSAPVDDTVLAQILHAGQIAPTACNSQAFHVYVLKSEAALATVNAHCKCIFGAPVVLLVCSDTSREWHNKLEPEVSSGQQDAAIVGTHMMLEAWEQGIGSCWVNLFANSQLAKALNLPENHRPVFLMPIGHPAPDAKPATFHSQSRPAEELMTVL